MKRFPVFIISLACPPPAVLFDRRPPCLLLLKRLLSRQGFECEVLPQSSPFPGQYLHIAFFNASRFYSLPPHLGLVAFGLFLQTLHL